MIQIIFTEIPPKFFSINTEEIEYKSKKPKHDVLWKAVRKGIRDCVKHHGPIVQNYIGSAVKRVVNEVSKVYISKDQARKSLNNTEISFGVGFRKRIKRYCQEIELLQEKIANLEQEVNNLKENNKLVSELLELLHLQLEVERKFFDSKVSYLRKRYKQS